MQALTVALDMPRAGQVIPSHEMSGVVAEVGTTVSEVNVGDQVYGLVDFSSDGAAAEFVAIKATDLARKPRSLIDVARGHGLQAHLHPC
jgi:NADPH:quinone reductase-like Zn-dependent oxidoreductase